jgi:IclR family KDG regulon transcriptional repressor
VKPPHALEAPGGDYRAAVDKAVGLMMSFTGDGTDALGVTELARRAELSKSTAFRVLHILERNAVVERVGNKYRLGTRLYELTTNATSSGHEHIRDLLTPFIADAYAATHETVHLVVLHGTDVVYLAKLYGHRPVRSPSRIGGRVPAYCTAAGKALLAYDHRATEQTLSAPLRKVTPKTIADARSLEAVLDKARADGVAYDDEESQLGLSCVGVPIFGPGGHPVAAMSIARSTGRPENHLHETILRRIAASASQAVMRSSRLTPVQTPSAC